MSRDTNYGDPNGDSHTSERVERRTAGQHRGPSESGTDHHTDGEGRSGLPRRGVLKLLGGTAIVGSALEALDRPVRAAPGSVPSRLLPDDPTKDALFGIEVALDDGANTALIAAPGVDAAYAFSFDGSGWSQTQKLTGIDADYVALDDSGTVAVVEPRVYTYDGSDWNQGPELDHGPVSLDASGTTALIGNTASDNSAEVYAASGGSWSRVATLTPDDPGTATQFGHDVALNGDGTVAVVGDNRNGSDNRGAVYVFASDGSGWSQAAKLKPSGLPDGRNLGASVGVDHVGETAVAGTVDSVPLDGAAYVFGVDGGDWGMVETLEPPTTSAAGSDSFGADVAIADDGRTALVGEATDSQKVTGAGAVQVYSDDGSGWAHEARLDPATPTESEQLGISVALSGSTVLGGAFGYEVDVENAGAAYVFDRTDTLPSVTLSDVRPIQVVEDSVLRNPGGANSQVTPALPDLVAGKLTSVLFNLTGSTDLDALASDATVAVTIRRQFADGSTDTTTFDLETSELQALADGSTDEAAFFDANRSRAEKLPVFEATEGLEEITVAVDPDVDGDGTPELSAASDTIRIGSDVEVHAMDTFTVGYIEIGDPEDGDNYGDDNGFIKDDAGALAFELSQYLEDTYPVEDVDTYDAGLLNESDYLNTSSGGDEGMIEDLMMARWSIFDEYPGQDFDVTVAFVPEDYPDFHDDEGFFGVHYRNVRASALVRGDLREDGSENLLNHTGAQEIGHHFLVNGDSYPDGWAMRNREDGEVELDNAHARTRQAFDPQVIDSTGFDLGSRYGLKGRNMDSFMSYSNDFPVWADAHAYQTMLETDLDHHSSGSGPTQRSAAGLARLEADDTASFRRVFTIDETTPQPGTPGAAVTLSVVAGDGSVLDERTVEDHVEFSRHAADTSDSGGTVENLFSFVVPYPLEAAAVQVEYDGTVTRLNPAERSLRDAIARLPDDAFRRSPDDRRAALFDKLDAIEEMMAKGKYHPAKRKMEKDIRDKIVKWLRDDYETGPLVPTKEELLDTVDEFTRRLDTLQRTPPRPNEHENGGGGANGTGNGNGGASSNGGGSDAGNETNGTGSGPGPGDTGDSDSGASTTSGTSNDGGGGRTNGNSGSRGEGGKNGNGNGRGKGGKNGNGSGRGKGGKNGNGNGRGKGGKNGNGNGRGKGADNGNGSGRGGGGKNANGGGRGKGGK